MKDTSVTLNLPAIAAGLVLAGMTAPALADPPHCPPGHARQGLCDANARDSRHDAAHVYEQGYRDGRRDAFRVGERFERDEYLVIRDYARYDLTPPPHGYYYVVVDDDVLMIEAATRLIAELIDG